MRMTLFAAAGILAMAGAASAAESTDAKDGPIVLDEAQMDQVAAGFGHESLLDDLLGSLPPVNGGLPLPDFPDFGSLFPDLPIGGGFPPVAPE